MSTTSARTTRSSDFTSDSSSESGDAWAKKAPHGPSESKLAKISDVLEIDYDTFGNERDPPILLIMGLAGQKILFQDEFCQSLVKRGFYVIRFDNRDIGLSSKMNHLGQPNLNAKSMLRLCGIASPGSYALEDMADDVVGLMDALGIEKAHILGLSMGGMIAQLVGLRHPDRVRSLCLIMTSTSAPSLPNPTMAVTKIMLAKPPESIDGRVEHNAHFMRAADPSEGYDEPDIRAVCRQCLERSQDNSGVARQTVASITAPDRTRALGDLRIPTLIIHGRRDALFRLSHGEALHAAIHESTFVVYDEMGHFMNKKNYDSITKHVQENATRTVDWADHYPPNHVACYVKPWMYCLLFVLVIIAVVLMAVYIPRGKTAS